MDISLDGSVSWVPARLKGLVLDKALTRFSLVTKWDGQPWLLQSRAIHETGYIQPTLGQLREIRGTNSICHKNSIHTWKIAANGGVTNVKIS